ncbi:MAG: hypothetical protein JRF32_02765, partial [Deltaproteobacteria bacterium]|nr:hypothetical protein [Deltaproteobacteria bacterium]
MMQQLTQILKSQFNIAESDLSEALKIKDEKGGDVGDILLDKMLISEDQLLSARGIQ